MRSRRLALATALVVAACNGGTEVDATSGSTAVSVADTTSTTAAAPTTTTPTDTTTAAIQLRAWLGTYSWVEFVEGDPGSDQTLVHELVLDEVTDLGLSGSFSQYGFQTFAELTIEAVPMDGGIEIVVVSIDEGIAGHSSGDVLFRLSGDGTEPTTTLVALATLTQPSAAGSYFVQGRAAVVVETASNAVWAVDATTYDLQLVDLDTGEVLDSVAGWGFDAANPDEGPAQALQTLEVDANGWVWVDDCCEPAFGNTFGIDPATDTSIAAASVRLLGLNPRVAPSGDLVAVAIGDTGVGVFDARTGASVVSSQTIYSVTTDSDFAFLVPVGWIDDTTIAVAEAGDSTFTVSFVDITDPDRPELAAEPTEVEGVVLDSDFRGDRTVAILTAPEPGSPTRSLVIVDPGSIVDVVDLPDGTTGIDYDATGQGLLYVTGAGSIQPFGEPPVDGSIGPFVDAAH